MDDRPDPPTRPSARDDPRSSFDVIAGSQRGEELDQVIGDTQALVAVLAQGDLRLEITEDGHRGGSGNEVMAIADIGWTQAKADDSLGQFARVDVRPGRVAHPLPPLS